MGFSLRSAWNGLKKGAGLTAAGVFVPELGVLGAIRGIGEATKGGERGPKDDSAYTADQDPGDFDFGRMRRKSRRNPKHAAIWVNNYQKSLRDRLYTPLYGRMAEEMKGIDQVKGSRANFMNEMRGAEGRSARNASRYGTQVDAATQQYLDKQKTNSLSADYGAMMGQARADTMDAKDSARRGIVNVGRGVMNNAVSAAGVGANNQAQMDAGNAAAKAGKDQANISTGAAVASTLAMIAIVAK